MGALHCYIETTRMIQKRTLIRNVVSGRSLCPDRAVSDRSDDISDKPRALIVNECKLHQLLSRHFGSPLHFNILRINADGGLQERCGFPLTVSNTETESNYMRRLLLTKIQPCVSQTDIDAVVFLIGFIITPALDIVSLRAFKQEGIFKIVNIRRYCFGINLHLLHRFEGIGYSCRIGKRANGTT